MNGGSGCVEHLAQESLASHSALFQNDLHPINLQRESPMLQPGLVKTLPETNGDAAMSSGMQHGVPAL